MIEERYPEVAALLRVGKEKGYLLYEEMQTVLSDEVTGTPMDLEEVYVRLFDLGVEIVTDPDRAARRRAALEAETAEEAREAVEKTNDPVRMYLREMGTVKLLDREGEVRIAKRIEQGEAKIYQALANNPVVLEEILKLLESAGRDARMVKELVNPSDEAEEEEMDDRATRRIEGVLASFKKIGALDKDIKRMKFKARTIKRGSKSLARIESSIDRRIAEMANLIRAADFTPAVLNRAIGILRDIDRQMSVPESTMRQDTLTLKREKNPARLDFYRRRIAKYRKALRELEEKFGVTHEDVKKTAAHGARGRGGGRPGEARADRGEPAPRRLDREEVHEPRTAVPRPDSGRQHRPDEGGREIRAPARLQVLDVRDVVDPPGDHARHRRPGAHDPHPRAHDRDDQQADAHVAVARAGARPRAQRRGDRRSAWTCRSPRSARS